MKHIIAVLFLIGILAAANAACGSTKEEEIDMEPQKSQMEAICELAVMKCYYHNVAKYKEEGAEGLWLWKKDKHFWIEYSGEVTLGIDVSQVKIEVEGSRITITLPEAEVQGCKALSASLTKDSYIVDKQSAKITAEDETYALKEAQDKLAEVVAGDRTLLMEARQRAQSLLEDYVRNINRAVDKDKKYTIHWIYVDKDGKQQGTADSEFLPDTQGDMGQEAQGGGTDL